MVKGVSRVMCAVMALYVDSEYVLNSVAKCEYILSVMRVGMSGDLHRLVSLF